MHLPLFLSINETVPSVEECEIIHVLDVALLEVGVDTEFLSQEVQRIKGFSLCFADRWYLRVAWKLAEAHEITPAILQKNPLRCGLSGRLVEQQRSLRELLLGVLFKSGPIYVRVAKRLR